MTVLDQLQDKAKALAGALAGAIISVLQTTVTDPEGSLTNVELPNTSEEWTAFAVAVAIGFVLPYLKKNYPSVSKARDTLKVAEERVRLDKQSV
jgi:fructose-specific phosphotransferase system IIC component